MTSSGTTLQGTGGDLLDSTWEAIARARRITGSQDDAARQAKRRAHGNWRKSLSARNPNASKKGRSRRHAGSGGRGGRHK